MSKTTSYFKGFLLLSFKGISMLFFLLCSAFLAALFTEHMKYRGIAFLACYLPLAAIAIFYYGYQMFYFGIAGKELIVRNTLFFWWSRKIPLAKIRSIRIDITRIGRSEYYTPYYLRVFFDYPDTKKFYAATLSGKRWSQLAEALEHKGIRVVNECPYIPFKDML